MNYDNAKKNLQEKHKDDLVALQMAKIIAWAVEISLGLDECVFSNSRGTPSESHARQIVQYLLNTGFSISYDRIAYVMGRDRSTIAFSIQKIEDMRDDKAFDAYLDEFLEICKNLSKIREIKYDFTT